MCDTVIVNNLECQTKSQLKSAIGIEPIKDARFKRWKDDDCLCPCDLEATAKKAKMSITGNAWDGYVLVPNPTA